MQPSLLTSAEVAKRLRISPATVARHANSGALPSTRVGRLLRFPVGPVEQIEAGERLTADGKPAKK